MPHIPVLLKETVEVIDPKEGGFIIDGTGGGGGHSREILKRIGKTGKLLIVDWDETAAAALKEKFQDDPNIKVVCGNYADLKEILNGEKADGLVLDLGFSSLQIEGGRGFSFLKEEPLTMTYCKNAKSLGEFLKETDEKELTRVISEFGEERYAPRIAQAIIANLPKITNTRQLADAIRNAVPGSYEKGRIHPATRTFQALRIYLNKELENLGKITQILPEILKIAGRAGIISFHSLEDRIVKNNFKDLEKKGRLKILTKKPIVASSGEINTNPRARSAKLRAVAVI